MAQAGLEPADCVRHTILTAFTIWLLCLVDMQPSLTLLCHMPFAKPSMLYYDTPKNYWQMKGDGHQGQWQWVCVDRTGTPCIGSAES